MKTIFYAGLSVLDIIHLCYIGHISGEAAIPIQSILGFMLHLSDTEVSRMLFVKPKDGCDQYLSLSEPS